MLRKLIYPLILLLTACSASQQLLYQSRPQINDLNPAILNHAMFQQAPLPQVKRLQYVSTSYPEGKTYSDYNIFPEKSRGVITQYRTREHPPAEAGVTTPNVNGEGVGYGGIFMLLYRKQGVVASEPNFYQKYAMTEITNVKGQLFPLKVGNELSFNYRAVHTENYTGDQELGQTDHGIMVYKVVEEIKNYSYELADVPGPIYKIQVWRTTVEQPKLQLQYAYYFSPRLGWYVWAQYFADNRLVANYRLINYWYR